MPAHARSCRCDECQAIARAEHDYAASIEHLYRIVRDGARVSLIHGPACPRCAVRP